MNRANCRTLSYCYFSFCARGSLHWARASHRLRPPQRPEPAAAAAPAPDLAAQVADLTAKAAGNKVALDTVWTLITAFLVFWMNAGFALVESGMCRVKNAVNILSKNFIVFALSSLAFFVVGWGLMFGDGNAFMGLKGYGSLAGPTTALPRATPTWVSTRRSTGRVSRSTRSSSSNWSSQALRPRSFRVAWQSASSTSASSSSLSCWWELPIRSPVTGSGAAVGSRQMGFWDFAGSTVVHTVGGVAGLAGILMLGPRIGKYKADGSVNAIPGHNMTSATLGLPDPLAGLVRV